MTHHHDIGLGITVVHRGQDFAVVDKPAGVRTVPGRDPADADSVERRVAAAFPDATGPLIVHRLDIETSGLLVVGLTRPAHRRLSRQFMHRKVGKTYAAILDGGGDLPDEGAIDLRLCVDWPNRPRQRVDRDKGKRARTLFRVVGREDGRTRIAFRPITGRTHQLRVHAATPRNDGGMGAPIAGDTLYGDPASAPRLMLHADHLAFWCPTPGDTSWLKFASPAPF